MKREEIYNIVLEDIKKTIATYQKNMVIYNSFFSERDCSEGEICSDRHEPGIPKELSYNEIFREHYNKHNYAFLLFDGSIIQFSYKFEVANNKKVVSKTNLLYYPNPDPRVPPDFQSRKRCFKLYFDKVKEFDVNMEHYINDNPDEYILGTYSSYSSRYIRVDYSSQEDDFTDVIHPRCHIHIGLNNDFRVGVNKVPLLSEFIDLILYLHYNIIWEEVNGICESNSLISHIHNVKNEICVTCEEDLLSKNEIEYIHISI